jgi:O-6-methylguanine DNA methyltransferase
LFPLSDDLLSLKGNRVRASQLASSSESCRIAVYNTRAALFCLVEVYSVQSKIFQPQFLKVLPVRGAGAELSALKIKYGCHPTPLGRCLIGTAVGRICYLAFAPSGTDPDLLQDLMSRWPGAMLVKNQKSTGRTMKSIFPKNQPSALPTGLLLRGTPFQVKVWKALLDIPQGETRTYADLARSIGRPRAVRAVGSAIGANLIAWLIPCHRVVRSDGGLGGYRWGIAAKQACLYFEKEEAADTQIKS